MLAVLTLLVWVALSVLVAPVLGIALRRCEASEQQYSVEVLRSKAQHPANQAA
jgi:hypothetical protein